MLCCGTDGIYILSAVFIYYPPLHCLSQGLQQSLHRGIMLLLVVMVEDPHLKPLLQYRLFECLLQSVEGEVPPSSFIFTAHSHLSLYALGIGTFGGEWVG